MGLEMISSSCTALAAMSSQKMFFGILILSAVLRASSAETVCYGILGCFTTAPPWTSNVRPISALPEDPSVINTTFFLYTRSNPETEIVLKTDDALGLYTSPYSGAKKTVFLIHGWTNDAKHSWILTSVHKLLEGEDVNVITVDWAPGAGLPYLRATANIQVVGAEIYRFILFLSTKATQALETFHLVGHNLGAHAASYAGHRIFGLGRITGLDPATIYFEGGDAITYLDPTDAVYVDIIHTDAPHGSHIGLGFASTSGHVDIHPNNGMQQPGCTDTINSLVSSAQELVTFTNLEGPIDPYVCSHMRAAEYFAESIYSFCPWTAYPCASWSDYQGGFCFSTCNNKPCTSLGYHAAQYTGRGLFFLDTQSFSPYCNVVIRVELDIAQAQKDTRGTINYILIGDIGQTKEEELYSGQIMAGFILGKVVTLPGSNPLRIGHVDAVRLIYHRNTILSENQVYIQHVIVQQSNITIDAFDNVFEGVILNNGDYSTVYPTAP